MLSDVTPEFRDETGSGAVRFTFVEGEDRAYVIIVVAPLW